jgi:hypothetical protein
MAMAMKNMRAQRLIIGAVAASSLVMLALTLPAAAQASFLERLFGPPPGAEPARPPDYSRAPSPRKVETPPTGTVLVLGDSMADWLAYGLEEALLETPEIGIVRKPRASSGLIRYDNRNETLDWAQAARDLLAAERPNFIVMMIGLNDRQSIRVRQPPPRKPGAPPEKKPPAADQEQSNPEQPSIVAPESEQASRVNMPGVYEFHSERWEELYVKRIDETIAVLKSRNVPVFWVGLPSVRGPKSTSEVSYLNELFRSRADKAGIVYVDVWDGFVDEQGRFALQGPDFEGQNRRLRAGDGVHFTKAGARKLAHYLERELNRFSPTSPTPVALPGAEPLQQAPKAKAGGSIARPLAGPAIPLAAYTPAGEGLIGNNTARATAASQLATQVLEKGEPMAAPAGRADDFAWPRRGIAAFGSDSVVTTTTMPVPLAQAPLPSTNEPAAKTAAKPTLAQPRPQPRPTTFSPFSFFDLFR